MEKFSKILSILIIITGCVGIVVNTIACNYIWVVFDIGMIIFGIARIRYNL